jgi:hypothetical protein
MGFLLTLVYIALALLSPNYLLPTLTPYHLQVAVAVAAMLASIPPALHKNPLAVPQSITMGIVILLIPASFVLTGWFGGAVMALDEFIPNAIVFFLVLINCRKPSRLRILGILLIAIAAYLVVNGAIAYATHDASNPWLYVETTADGGWYPRIRGFGVLHDPNDFGQFLVMVVPLIWLRARAPSNKNRLQVALPSLLLGFGMFLTHSRGSLVALAAVLLFLFKDRLGAVKSLITVGIAFLLLKLLNYTGGREISVQAGAGRIDLWQQGFDMLVAHPVLGVGFTQYHEFAGLAAHNSYIHCAAELGLVGYSFWMALIVLSMMQLNRILNAPQPVIAPVARAAAAPDGVDLDFPPQTRKPLPEATHATVQRWAKFLRLSFVGFLTAGFFISRPYALTFFLLLGMAAALRCISVEQAGIEMKTSYPRLLRITAGFVLGSLFLIYVFIRIRWLR